MSSNPSLQEAIEHAERLIQDGHEQDAADLLKTFVPHHADNPDLHFALGYAYTKAGHLWNAAVHYSQAQKLRRDPDFWFPLGTLFADLGLYALALDAFRKALKFDPEHPWGAEIHRDMEAFEERILVVAYGLDLTSDRAERGLRFFEEGQIALHEGAFTKCISLNRRAIQILGDFPPCYNNLSLALFFGGNPEEAIRSAHHALSLDPQNIQALANMIRFLAWTGRVTEAHTYWRRLRELEPTDHSLRVKMAEAAAMVEDDEEVYRLLTMRLPGEEVDRAFTLREELHLAVAEANLGHKYAAKRLKDLAEHIPLAQDLLEAFEAGHPGPGFAQRFPYFHATELLPDSQLMAFFKLLERRGQMSEGKFHRQVQRFATRFPQLVLFAEKIILEEANPPAGISILEALGTPEAYKALRRIGLGQAADDEARMQALFALQRAGQLAPDETLRVWQDGEWREIRLQTYEITDAWDLPYSEEVNTLIERATEADQQGREEEAERLFKRVLRWEPRAKEACNNLGTIYARRGEKGRARELFQEAIEIDPLYLFPRCNLALYLLADDKPDEAQEMIEPLLEITTLRVQEMAFLSVTRARIHAHRGEYDQARKLLELALEVLPDYELATKTLEDIEVQETWLAETGRLIERGRRRRRDKRAGLQRQLTTAHPTLEEALGLYTKDTLTAIARNVISTGGWSTLRKAQLRDRIVQELRDLQALAWIVEDLDKTEKTALRMILENGGSMPWEAFDKEFGNDLQESQTWIYHQPASVMGRLRARGLLAEATVGGQLLVVIPVELRESLRRLLREHG